MINIKEVADSADVIVNGYAYILKCMKNGLSIAKMDFMGKNSIIEFQSLTNGGR